MSNSLPHILLLNYASRVPFTTPPTGGGRPLAKTLKRAQHAAKLLNSLGVAVPRVAPPIGSYVTVELEPKAETELKSLENRPKQIELVSVKYDGDKPIATLWAPPVGVEHLFKTIEDYRDKATKTGKPAHQPLVENIVALHPTTLDMLWTDEASLFPTDGKEIWWEVWLRKNTAQHFRQFAKTIQLRLGEKEISILDRVILLAYGTPEKLRAAIPINCIAELRLAKELASFFLGLDLFERRRWSDEFSRNITAPPPNAPSVCLLDSGVNRAHPLLAPALAVGDQHAYDPAWEVFDNNRDSKIRGHGSGMAGLALYDDLVTALASNQPILLQHCLESVKVLPKIGTNDPDLYAAITAGSVQKVEKNARQRNFCMAVTTTDNRDRGKPSSWSSQIDALAANDSQGTRRLFLISAGNTDPEQHHNYPNNNLSDQIHDPGQSWNALTVGAYTEKTTIQSPSFTGWKPVAPVGDLSPSSTTSVTWSDEWPIKPDIVMEGGNSAIQPGIIKADQIEDLALLSTHYDHNVRLFTAFGDTSAATALASRMAALIQAQYPIYWPETIRALMVHSAEWTTAMKKRFLPSLKSRPMPPARPDRKQLKHLLRCCGFGVPSLEQALWCAKNHLTLIAQDEVQPFEKDKSKEMAIYQLPWPKDVLNDLGSANLEMRITLSYFIEPNPGRRGYVNRYNYASHGLQFDIKTPTESEKEFRKRINKAERDKGEKSTSKSDSGEWLLGSIMRSNGSLHSDRWYGTAAQLAQRNCIGIYPTTGWWKERHQLGNWKRSARFALIVSLHTENTSTDIYTTVLNQIKTKISV